MGQLSGDCQAISHCPMRVELDNKDNAHCDPRLLEVQISRGQPLRGILCHYTRLGVMCVVKSGSVSLLSMFGFTPYATLFWGRICFPFLFVSPSLSVTDIEHSFSAPERGHWILWAERAKLPLGSHDHSVPKAFQSLCPEFLFSVGFVLGTQQVV